jgi:hypothetical protein
VSKRLPKGVQEIRAANVRKFFARVDLQIQWEFNSTT